MHIEEMNVKCENVKLIKLCAWISNFEFRDSNWGKKWIWGVWVDDKSDIK